LQKRRSGLSEIESIQKEIARDLRSLGAKTKLGKKRVQLTAKQRMYIWEHPKKYGRTCSICGEKITKMSDLELDHTKPYSKGGTRIALAHRDCNRMKASGSLGKIQRTMKFPAKTTRKRRQSRSKPRPKRPKHL
jgi:5-methylcytosine-specific restriction endonuclease McrA